VPARLQRAIPGRGASAGRVPAALIIVAPAAVASAIAAADVVARTLPALSHARALASVIAAYVAALGALRHAGTRPVIPLSEIGTLAAAIAEIALRRSPLDAARALTISGALPVAALAALPVAALAALCNPWPLTFAALSDVRRGRAADARIARRRTALSAAGALAIACFAVAAHPTAVFAAALRLSLNGAGALDVGVRRRALAAFTTRFAIAPAAVAIALAPLGAVAAVPASVMLLCRCNAGPAYGRGGAQGGDQPLLHVFSSTLYRRPLRTSHSEEPHLNGT